MRVLNYTGAMLTFLNYRTNCARRQRKFITGTAKMEPGGEWICCCCPADAFLISVLHYKHPIWHSLSFHTFTLALILCLFVFGSCVQTAIRGFLQTSWNIHMPSHKLIWHFISPLVRHISILTRSKASLHKSWSLPFSLMHPSQHIGFADIWRSFLMSDLIWS